MNRYARYSLLLATAGLALGSAAGVHAQAVEAEWRVINEVSATAVPPYAGGPNPFPMREVLVVVEPEPEITEEQKEEMRKAEIIAEARKLINSAKIFRPNLSGVSFKGYLKGPEGEKVMYHGNWLAVGDVVKVPVTGAQQAYDVIGNLQDIDPEAANSVREELQSRLSQAANTELKITKIEENKVTLNSQGQNYTIKFENTGF